MTNPLNIPNEFLECYAAALRMEPDSRTTDLENGIAARIADPLWFLTRQWQVSEFEGEDAGSPIDVCLSYITRSLKPVKLRDDDGNIISDTASQPTGSLPMEKLIEQEWLEIDWTVAAQIGQEFEKQIYIHITNADDHEPITYIESYRAAFPFQFKNDDDKSNADETTRQFVGFMKGRIVNGQAILNGLNFSDDLLSLPSNDLQTILPNDTLQLIALHLIKWCNAMNIKKTSARSKAWRNEQLDYHFTLDTSKDDSVEEKALTAPEYRSGSLDWYTFNACSNLHNPAKWSEHSLENQLPTPINIMGISRRWWEFEDANIDFGHIEVGKIDIAKSLLMQYALVYGDDWYSLPLTVPVSSLAKINSLQVSNVFGQTENINPAYYQNDPSDPMEQFRLFTLSPAKGATEPSGHENPMLYIPSVLSFRQESDPLEEARFIRDEWSNMVWCIEHTVLNGMGKPVDGYKAQLDYFEYRKEAIIEQLLTDIEALKIELSALEPEAAEYIDKNSQMEFKILELKELSPELAREESLFPKYRLATSVPENWIPFKPYNTSKVFGEMHVRLRRAQMLRNTFNDEPEPIQAKTRLLEISDNPLLWLEESVIPRSGLRICLTNQRIRWTDGQTFVWKGRKTLTGQGEGQSGLIFDKVFNL